MRTVIVTYHGKRRQEAAYYSNVRVIAIVLLVGSAAAVPGRPIQLAADAYVSSDACRSCHPSEYASWQASYHRTMTAIATPESVRANFDEVVTDVPGNPIQLEQRGSEFWATLNDPDAPAGAREPSRIERQIVMTTGSH